MTSAPVRDGPPTSGAATPRLRRPLTRLQVRPAPMIALACLLAALTTYGALAGALLASFILEGSADRDTMIGLIAMFILAALVQLALFAPALWTLHRRKVATSGRRWFAFIGLASGLLEAALIALPNVIGGKFTPLVLVIGCAVFGALGAAFGATGGLVFAVTATRRVPLEAVFE